MQISRVYLFGREVFRWEREDDPVISLAEAIAELAEEHEQEFDEEEADQVYDRSFVDRGRVADETETPIFSSDDEDL